jgi:hypothetical protein
VWLTWYLIIAGLEIVLVVGSANVYTPSHLLIWLGLLPCLHVKVKECLELAGGLLREIDAFRF